MDILNPSLNPQQSDMSTTIIDPTQRMPKALAEHIRQCAYESGVDHCEYHSCERSFTLPDGREVESWYEESSASPYAWRAFVKGIGTRSGLSREDAVAAAITSATTTGKEA